ncbi:hypothetical protein OAK75_11990 [Bacteriovoracales bacterium]|nr:hypothetical protein [Bacteriovoracales bacterium]
MVRSSFIIFNLLFLVGTAFFIKKTVVPFKLLNTLSKNNPIVSDFKKFQKKYGDEKTLIFATYLKKPDQAFSEIDKLTKSIQNFSPELNVRSLTSSYYVLSKGIFRTNKLKDDVLNSPYYDIFWDKNKEVAIIYIQSKENLGELIKFLQKRERSFFFGHGYFQEVVKKESINDQKIALPLFIVITFFFFYFLFGSFKVCFAALNIILISYLSTLTFVVFIEKTISPFGSLALLISFTMAISDIIHYFYKRPDFKVMIPCFYTSLTTAIGFLSLCISNILPVSNFGLFGAFAVFISFGSTFLILPFMTKYFNIMPLRRPVLKISLYSFCLKNRYTIIGVFIFFTLFFSFQIRNLKFEDNFLNQFKKEHIFSKSADFFREKLQFSGTLDLIIKGRRETLLSTEFMKVESELKKELLNHSSITGVYSALDIKEDLLLRSELNRENIKILDFFLFFDRLVPEGLEESRFIVTLKDIGSRDMESIFEFVENSKFDIKISGYSKVRYHIMRFLFQTFYGSLFLSFTGIFLCFLFLFRSLKLALVGLIPNILPLVFVSGMQGLLSIGTNFYLVVLNCIVLGISVDDTIHFLYHFKKHKGDLKSFLPLISPPLIMTTTLFCLLFPCFMMSSFISFSHMSFFLCSSFIVALLADLTVLPSLLKAR